MSMTDNKCDVCHVNEPIGVACTSIPLSVAYCEECARRRADPEVVFVMWEEDIGHPKNHRCPDHASTFVDGKYITYRKWYYGRHHDAKHKNIVVEQTPKSSE